MVTVKLKRRSPSPSSPSSPVAAVATTKSDGSVSTLEGVHSASQSMRTRAKMCLDLAIGVLRVLFEKAPVRQGRFGAKFVKRQLFFDTQFFLFRMQKVIFGVHTAVPQGFNVVFCQSKCLVVVFA